VSGQGGQVWFAGAGQGVAQAVSNIQSVASSIIQVGFVVDGIVLPQSFSVQVMGTEEHILLKTGDFVPGVSGFIPLSQVVGFGGVVLLV